jgi:AraC-like DNA-binding protein
MRFIEIEKSVQKSSWNMKELHSHPYYEIYYLYRGSRTFLLSNALYLLSAPTLVIIPPYTMHKTEGGPFERYNINVYPEYVNRFQEEILRSKALQPILPSEELADKLLELMRELSGVDTSKPNGDEAVNALFSYFIYRLGKINTGESSLPSAEDNKMSPLVLRTINYFNEHYADTESISLDALSRELFASKTTLIYNFKKYTNCSPMEFLLSVRLTKAKEQLANTQKSVESVALDCGFSSANYFGLIFKKKEGISPSAYRKKQRTKGQ